MAGKRGLIMGLANDKSIAWGIAKACADAGAELAFSYQGDALKKRVEPLAAALGSSLVLPCDVGDDGLVDALFEALRRAGASSTSWSTPSAFPTRTSCAAATSTPAATTSRHDDGHLGLFLHRRAQRAEKMMTRGRLGADADLLRRRAGDAALQRDGRGQGRAGGSVRYLAEDLGRDGIRVNAISAGRSRRWRPRASAISATS
jgi:enoyl-[acyl-carrier protein] reductase I